ncbi:MAG: phenylalanine--tRNA ligase subunit alpha, partial [Myxococcota bacterium]|nr:phenylalanine--tRNA ligase subunit alpha [Myxococcota bacterium]
MSATVEQVQVQFEQEASLAADVSSVEQLRVRFLGKKGLVAQLMRQLGQIEPADRPAFGARINAL